MTPFAFPLQFNFLDIIIKGMIIGIVCSAPMGPVGILCVQRTLNKGRWFGFVTGLGATLSDIIYALLTGFGMSFAMELIDNPQNKFFLQIFGSVLLFIFGLYCFKSDPRNKVHQGKGIKGSLTHNFVTAFIVTFSNAGGALLWWYGLTWMIDKVREFFSLDAIKIINRIIGTIVMVFSFAVFMGTAFNLFSIFTL